jgi:hypothetical protein
VYLLLTGVGAWLKLAGFQFWNISLTQSNLVGSASFSFFSFLFTFSFFFLVWT